jgi:hypothetical protein
LRALGIGLEFSLDYLQCVTDALDDVFEVDDRDRLRPLAEEAAAEQV